MPSSVSPEASALLAVAVIILVAQLLGQLADRWGQPRVIGEIVGGILLGPSLLGMVAPGLEQALFSASVRGQLNLLGQLGLVLFMFLVGVELDPALLRGRITLAGRITAASLLVPLVLGVLLALGLERWQPGLLPGDRNVSGALFMGAAMAITAFPVLARILRERGLLNLPIGALALTAASIEDALDWVLLAAVVAFARSGSALAALPVLFLMVLWAAALILVTRPLRRILASRQRRGEPPGPLLQSILMAGALASAVVTDWIGVHLIFGAFLWGLMMPRHVPLQQWLELRLESVVLRLLLPIFFAMSGLNTRIGSLNSPALWAAAVLVLVVAVGSKFMSTWLVARACGVPEREARVLGWLMNTRGLTELVVLNVGLQLGLISSELFTIGVLMALATTVMTGPLLSRLGYGRRVQLREPSPAQPAPR